jgi:hypothetical protein
LQFIVYILGNIASNKNVIITHTVKSMPNKTWVLWSIAPIVFIVLGIMALEPHPVTAISQQQIVYQTPTARPDGRVVYIVQANDNCLRIQLLTGATIDQLRTLNKLDQNCTINPGQELLLAVITPVASATPNPKLSPTPLFPTPTVPSGNGKICVTLFNDINGNAVHEDTEDPIAGGAVSITDVKGGGFSKTIDTTDSPDPICESVPEGKYNVSMAIPSGYNPTKMMNASVEVLAGDQAIFEFGAQVSTTIPEKPTGNGQTQKGSNNLPLAILGGVLVIGGIGLGVYVLFTRRGPTTS